MGSVLAAGLLNAGARVTLVERGERLEHLRRHGLTLMAPDGATRTYRCLAVRGPEEPVGEQDVVFLAVKTYDLREATSTLTTALAPHTVIVPLQNGIPWWYFQRHVGRLGGYRLKSLDPDGLLARTIDPGRIIACIPYPAATLDAGGTVRHVEGNRLPVGELDGSISPRLRQLAQLLESAGFRARVLDDVRSETWLKAWGNLSFNPLSALTGATLEELCQFGPTRRLASEMMREAQAVGEALGAHFRVSIERRIAGAEAVGAHRTSMAQDVEAGRPLETEALVGAVLELGEVLGIPTPSIRSIYAAVKLLEQCSRSTQTSGGPGTDTGVLRAPAAVAADQRTAGGGNGR